MESQTHSASDTAPVRPVHPSRSRNTRQQDLFLVSKLQYSFNGLTRAEAARLVVGVHNLHDPDTMSWESAAICTVNDLVGSVLKMEGDRINRFLLDMGPSILDGMLGAGDKFSQPGGYYRVLIDHVLTEACRVQVINDGVWLMDFAKPEVDPFILQYLQLHASK